MGEGQEDKPLQSLQAREHSEAAQAAAGGVGAQADPFKAKIIQRKAKFDQKLDSGGVEVKSSAGNER